MIDFFMALLGSKHCPWCYLKKDNIIDKYCGGHRSEQTRLQHIVWKIWDFDTEVTKIWRLGERHHYKHHPVLRVET